MLWKSELPRLISFDTSPIATKVYSMDNHTRINQKRYMILKVIYIYVDIYMSNPFTGLLAATPPSIRLNFLTFPAESLV